MSARDLGFDVRSSDRESLLARLRSRATADGHANLAHPMPPDSVVAVPEVVSTTVDPDDLVASFVRAATAVGAVVHVISDSAAMSSAVDAIVARHGVRRAVASKQREAWPIVELLSAAGVEVTPFDRVAASEADLGVSVASGAIATTGTIVQRSDEVGGRTVSLLPRVHLCVVPASGLVVSSADVLRGLGDEILPSNLLLVTGPSKSADIESTLVIGVHGPAALELVLVLDI